MLKTTITLLLILITGLISFGQQQKELDLTAIKLAVADSTSASGYQGLLTKFKEAPQYLYPYEGAIVYYGKLFSKDFDGFQQLFNREKFDKLMAEKSFEDLIAEGEGLLNNDPTSLKILIALMASYIETKDTVNATLTKAKINLLIPSILMYGNGTSDSTTIKVTSVEDEYVFMDILRLKGKSRKSIKKEHSFIDVWKIKKANDEPEKKIFFEVLHPF